MLDGGHRLGVISDRDLQRASASGANGSAPVRPLVSQPAITVTADTPMERAAQLMQENKIGCLRDDTKSVQQIHAAAQLMQENKIGCLPVVADDEGTLVGMVTESDIFAALIRSMGVLEPGSRIAVHLRDPLANLLAMSLVWLDEPVLICQDSRRAHDD